MELTFLDLRKKPGQVLEALERRENIILSRRGKAVARIVPIESVGHCSAAEHPAFGIWADHPEMEDYVLKAGLCLANALLAATAVEHQLALITGNAKHYRPIAELEVKAFRP